MGLSLDIRNNQGKLSEIKINYKGYLPESLSNKLYNSIAKIQLNNIIIGTGFFIQIYMNKKKSFYLLTSSHLITRKHIEHNLYFNIIYGKKENEIIKKIKLDINERFIRIYDENSIDITLIEIIESDNIPEDRFLIPDYNYKNGYDIYLEKDIYSVGYIDLLKDEKSLFFGTILNIKEYKFIHSLDFPSLSSVSPICLNNCVIGIINKDGKDKNNNLGTFIGAILDELIKSEVRESMNSTLSTLDILIDPKIYEKPKLLNNPQEGSFSENYFMDFILKKDCKPKEDYYEFFNFLNTVRRSDYFENISIFDKKEYIKLKAEFFKKYEEKSLSELEKASCGSFLGMAIGDAIGSRVEFAPVSYGKKIIKDMGKDRGGNFDLMPGQWTDNTSMGMCIADSLIEKKKFEPKDIMLRLILWWKYGYNNCFRLDNSRTNKTSVGVGATVKQSFIIFINNHGKNEYAIQGNPNASGNAPLMRNAAIPIYYFREEEKIAMDFSKKQSKITHQGDEVACCCQLLTYIIIKILDFKSRNSSMFNSEKKIKIHKTVYNMKTAYTNIGKYTLKDILDNLDGFKCENNSVNCLARSQQEGNNRERNWNWKDPNFRFNEERAKANPHFVGSYCLDGLSMALHALYTTNNFKDSILKVANLCADSGSISSIVGQIAGAFYGLYEKNSIPNEWILTLNKWDKNEIALRGYILCNFNPKISNKIFYS